MKNFIFRKMNAEDIPVYMDEMFSVLYDNMSRIAPIGCTRAEDYEVWSKNVVPPQTKYAEAYSHKKNIKSQQILAHLGLTAVGENANGNSLYFRGEYKTIFEMYSMR